MHPDLCVCVCAIDEARTTKAEMRILQTQFIILGRKSKITKFSCRYVLSLLFDILGSGACWPLQWAREIINLVSEDGDNGLQYVIFVLGIF